MLKHNSVWWSWAKMACYFKFKFSLKEAHLIFICCFRNSSALITLTDQDLRQVSSSLKQNKYSRCVNKHCYIPSYLDIMVCCTGTSAVETHNLLCWREKVIDHLVLPHFHRKPWLQWSMLSWNSEFKFHLIKGYKQKPISEYRLDNIHSLYIF